MSTGWSAVIGKIEAAYRYLIAIGKRVLSHGMSVYPGAVGTVQVNQNPGSSIGHDDSVMPRHRTVPQTDVVETVTTDQNLVPSQGNLQERLAFQ